MIAPHREAAFTRRASQPSRKSVAAAAPTSPTRMPVSAPTNPAASNRRENESTFGRRRSSARVGMTQPTRALKRLPRHRVPPSFGPQPREAPMPTTTELLKNVAIFKDLDEGELARVAEICKHELYESGAYVFREG